jgi:hypothetical protein
MNTTEEKKALTIKELKEWLEKPNGKEKNYSNVILKIKTMSEEDIIRKSIVCQFEYLDVWYGSNFVYEMLTKEISSYRNDLVSNGYRTLFISDILADQYPNNPPHLLFEDVAWWLANCIIHKCYEEGEILANIINKGLSTKFLKGGPDFKMAAWFILQMVNKCFGNVIDYSKFNYPENMVVYREALDNWNTKDPGLLDSIVSNLCEYHLTQASYGDVSDNAGYNDPAFLQFSETSWFVYAFEILTWLRVREKTGLKNPEKFTHPLMNLPLNRLPVEKAEIHKNELFETIVKKLKS